MENFKKMKTQFAKTLISALAASVAAFALIPAAQAQKSSEIRIATQPSPIYAPIFIAKEKGWLEDDLKKDGVAVKWSSFTSGPPINESFAAGQVDIGFLGDTPPIVAKSAGQDNIIFSTAAIGPTAIAVTVQKDSAIKTPADLKGKKVGVTKGSYAHHLLVLVLKNAGLKADDIKLIHLTPPDLVTAFVKGEIDAAATWDPFLLQLEDAGGKVLIDGKGIKEGLLVIVANRPYAEANPESIKKLLLAYRRGDEFIKANPEEAAKIISKHVRLSPEQTAKLLKKFDYSQPITPVTIAELKKTEDFLFENSIIRKHVDIDTFVDAKYLKDAGLQK